MMAGRKSDPPTSSSSRDRTGLGSDGFFVGLAPLARLGELNDLVAGSLSLISLKARKKRHFHSHFLR